MNVKDGPPGSGISRLERGAEIAEKITSALGDIRMGAAIGKGRGVLAVPLTYDTETMISFLHSLSDQVVTGGGTNLESLLIAAFGAFQDSIPSRRVVILFSDGETLSGSFQAAVDAAGKEKIILYTVGLGSDEGSPVPVEKSPDAPDGLLLAEDGSPVLSARQSGLLRNGAEKTGGVYLDGNRSDTAIALLTHINSLSSESRLSGHRREANPRWQVFVLAAIICLGGSRVMGYSRRSRHQNYFRKSTGAVLSLFCLFFLGSCDNTHGKLLVMEGNFFTARGLYTEAISSYLNAMDYKDAAPYAEFGLGTAYFALDEGSAALERYIAADLGIPELNREGHGELAYRVKYNMGIIYFEKGEYVEAARAVREALKIDSGRIEAKRNLELSLLTFNRTNVPQATSPEGSSENVREGTGSSSSVLFEYLKQKEQEQWKSREWTSEDDHSGPDY
jgi:Ca-activated chloride channel family protein